MTAIVEAIVWFCAGTAAGLAIGAWLNHGITGILNEVIDELMLANHRLRLRIAALEKKRARCDSEEWRDQ